MSSNPSLDALLRPVFRMFAWTFLVVGTLFFVFPEGSTARPFKGRFAIWGSRRSSPGHDRRGRTRTSSA